MLPKAWRQGLAKLYTVVVLPAPLDAPAAPRGLSLPFQTGSCIIWRRKAKLLIGSTYLVPQTIRFCFMIGRGHCKYPMHPGSGMITSIPPSGIENDNEN
jgi:hypothetical protein